MERGLLGGVGVARVPFVGREVIAQVAAELVRARLGEDLDAAISQTVVLRGERILVDSDLPDRVFGRQFPATKAIDEYRPAIRPGRRSGVSLNVGSEIVEII